MMERREWGRGQGVWYDLGLRGGDMVRGKGGNGEGGKWMEYVSVLEHCVFILTRDVGMVP